MRNRLGECLVRAGLITDDALGRALEEQTRSGDRLGVVIARLRLATEEQVARTLAAQLGFPFVDLDENPPNPAAVVLVPKETALQHVCIALAVERDVLTVAMADPLLFSVVQELEFQTAHRIRQVVATGGDIVRAIQTCYPDLAPPEQIPTASEASVRSAAERSDRGKQARRLADSILDDAVRARATAVHIDPVDGRGVVRHRVDGVLARAADVPPPLYEQVIARVKEKAQLDAAERRLPQAGRLRTGAGRTARDFRVTTLRTAAGETIVLRLLDREKPVPALEALGMSATALAELRDALSHQHGLIVVAGPGGSGRTTTFYAAMSEARSEQTSIITIEDPIEAEIPGISQIAAADAPDATVAAGLRILLQQDADVVGIGDLRDAETAKLAVEAARTDMLVIAVLAADDAVSAVARLMDAASDPGAIAGAALSVVAQRLVRRLCPACRRPYTPSADVLRSVGLNELEPASLVFNAAVGCDQCDHTGYRGRTGIFEVLRVTDRVRRLVAARASTELLRAAVTSAGMVTLADDAMSKVKAGVTTIDEVLRVLTHLNEVRSVCAMCGAAVAIDFVACPQCGTRLGAPCPHCGRTLQPGWNFCPYCARSAAPAVHNRKTAGTSPADSASEL